MKTYKQNLGKVSITIDKNPWTDSNCYDRLVVVRPEGEFKTYISRKPVPEGIALSDTNYWLPFTALDEAYVATLEALIANKLNKDGSNAQNFELDYFGVNRIYRQSQGQETPGPGILIPTINSDGETFLISSDREGWVHSASYDSNSKRINFYGNLNNLLCYIDATNFIKDGMIDNVYIADGKLIITFNTDSGKEDIEIPLTDIFNPNNYYTKTQVDDKLSLKQPVINVQNKLSADLVDDTNATHKFITSAERTLWNTVPEKAPLPFVVTCGIDPSDMFYVNSTLDEIWAAYQNGKKIRVRFAKAGGVSFEDDATLLLDGSRNCVAHTVHNGTHYIVTIYDDNGVTKLSYAETHDSDKQDTLVSGTNIKTINSQSILGSGNVSIHPEIVNLTDGENSSGYYENLMRTVDVLKLDTPQIFLYTSYNNNIATTAMCFSTCTNTEIPTTNVVIKQTLFLGTKKFIRTLSNTVSNNKYQVVNGWGASNDMTGDINLDSHALLVNKSGTSPRNGIKFVNNETGVLVGNGDMNTTIQSGVADLKHRKGSTDYTILDTSNVKTINGDSILGSSDIDTHDVFIAEYGVTTYQEIVDAYNAGKFILTNTNAILYSIYNWGAIFSKCDARTKDFTYYQCMASNDSWGVQTYTIETLTNKATDFDTINNTKYPTTQAVADYVSAIVGNINSILDTI